MKTSFILTAAAALSVAMPAHAEFTLGDRYTDSNGDLMADIPQDEAELIDPDTLIFAYTPVEDPAVYAEVWAGFLDHMEEVTGKNTQFFPVQSNAAQIEAMRAGRLHVAGFNTGSNPIAVACAGFRPFAMMAAEDGSFGYEMEIITYPGSGIDEIEDIKGNELTFTTETSNSGFKAPSAILKGEFGMVAGEDYDTSFSGAHDNSVLGVANEDYLVAPVANSVKNRMIDRDVVSEDQLESSTRRRPSRRRAMAPPTTSSPSFRKRSRTPSSASIGKAPRWPKNSAATARSSSSRFPSRRTGR